MRYIFIWMVFVIVRVKCRYHVVSSYEYTTFELWKIPYFSMAILWINILITTIWTKYVYLYYVCFFHHFFFLVCCNPCVHFPINIWLLLLFHWRFFDVSFYNFDMWWEIPSSKNISLDSIILISVSFIKFCKLSWNCCVIHRNKSKRFSSRLLLLLVLFLMVVQNLTSYNDGRKMAHKA